MIAAQLLRNSGVNLELFSSTSVNGFSIIVPAGIKAGDLAVVFNYGAGTPVAAVSPGSGWTLLSNLTLSTRRVTAYYKILDGTESPGLLSGMNDSFEALFLNIFRNTKAPIQSVSASVLGAEITTGNPSAVTLSAATVLPAITIAFATAGGGGHTWTTPPGAAAITTHSSTFYTGYYNIWPRVALSGSYDVDDDPASQNSLQVISFGINQ